MLISVALCLHVPALFCAVLIAMLFSPAPDPFRRQSTAVIGLYFWMRRLPFAFALLLASRTIFVG